MSAASKVPGHLAIIMDGNGRWARERMLPRPIGHRNGMKAVREVVEGALEVGLEALSLFAFSQENWQRPEGEVNASCRCSRSTSRRKPTSCTGRA